MAYACIVGGCLTKPYAAPNPIVVSRTESHKKHVCILSAVVLKELVFFICIDDVITLTNLDFQDVFC